jgi:hypothetical protein
MPANEVNERDKLQIKKRGPLPALLERVARSALRRERREKSQMWSARP